MNNHPEETAKAALDAFIDLLELAELAAAGFGPEGSEELQAEAQSTILKLIAAVMLADGSYDPGEAEFVKLLVDARDKPGGEISYLNQYAAQWSVASLEVPRFFTAAVQRDARDGTDIAQKMLRRIQLIGNYASISDGKFVASERETVRQYIAFLEDFIEAWRQEILGSGENETADASAEAPSSTSTPISRDEPPKSVRDVSQRDAQQPSGPNGWQSIG